MNGTPPLGPDTPDAPPIDTPPILPTRSDALRTGWLVAAVALFAFARRAAPTTYLLDSSELVATTAALGVSHPPGHPSYHLLGALWAVLSVGPVPFRIHLFSAFASALTLGGLPVVAHALGWVRSRAALAATGIVALGLGFGPAFAQQSIRAEVYALNALLTCAAWSVVVIPGTGARIRDTAVCAVLLGVGLLNHHLLIVSAMPAIAWAVWTSAPGPLRRLLWGCAFGAVALLGYAYLPASAGARPPIGWGWPSSPCEVWWHVSAQAFQKTAGLALERDPAAGIVNVVRVVADEWTPAGALAGLVGLALCARRDARIGVAMVVLCVLNVGTQVMFDFETLNPDARGYFMPTLWILGLGISAALSSFALPGRLGPSTERVRLALAGMVTLGVIAGGASSPLPTTLARYWDSERLRDEALAGLPPDSVWVTGYFETGFNMWFARAVEDQRPDVDLIHQSFLTYPFYREMLAGTRAAEVLAAAPGLVDVAALRRRAEVSGVQVEAEQLVSAELGAAVIPDRLYLRVVPFPLADGAFPHAITAAFEENLAGVRRAFGAAPDIQTARNLVWTQFSLAQVLCRAGRVDACRKAIEGALTLAPGEPTLVAFARDAGVLTSEPDPERARAPRLPGGPGQ